MNRWSNLIYHMERVLLVRENTFFKGIWPFRTQKFRTQVWVSSYPSLSQFVLSLSQFVPKFELAPTFESVRTQVWVSSYPSLNQFVPKFESVPTQPNSRFLPDFYPSPLFEIPPARARE